MIQHVTRVVTAAALEPCIRFYGLLGFEEVAPPAELRDQVRWLQLAPAHQPGHMTQLHLLVDPDAHPEQGHFAIVADSYSAVLTRLTAGGHTPDPHTPYWGAGRAFVRDPAGNLVELMERAPA